MYTGMYANESIFQVLLTTISFPAFSGRFATRVAATAAAPEEIPTYIKGPKLS